MPFVPKENREAMKNGEAPKTVGDQCYLEYLPMMEAWKKTRRWTTVHNEVKRVFGLSDEVTAKFLAVLVFVIKEAMPYEHEKEKENGPI